MYMIPFELVPQPPFDFDTSLAFMGHFGPTAAEHSVQKQRLRKAVRSDSTTLVFEITSDGTVDEPHLSGTLWSEEPLSAAVQQAALTQIGFYLSIDDALEPFYALAREDALFAPVLDALYGYHQVKFPTPFESAVWSILSQRTPQAMANQQKRNLVKTVGACLPVDGKTYWAFPTPQQVAALSEDVLVEIVRNGRKAEYIQGAARAFAAVEEEFLRNAPDAEVEEWLRRIKGIGVWSASLVMVRGLGRMAHLALMQPMVDVAALYYNDGKKMTQAEVAQIANRYGAWQGYWMHYLRAARR